MLAHHFIKWAASAPVSQRSAAANALARAYLQSRFRQEEVPMVEAVLTLLLDDPSPKVRGAIAEPLALSRDAPRHVISALAADQPEVSATILVRSDLIDERELANLVARRDSAIQRLIAGRPGLDAQVAAALAEHGDGEAIRRLLANPTATIADRSFLRIAERFGGNADLRARLLEHKGLPADVRHELITRLSRILCGSPLVLGCMGDARAERLARDSGRAAVLQLIDSSAPEEYQALAMQLIARAEMTTSFMVEVLAAGRLPFFGAALAVLARVAAERVEAILRCGNVAVLRALMRQGQLPEPLQRVALVAIRLWRGEGTGRRPAGPQESSWQMLHTLNGETEGLAAEIADLLYAIHGGNLRADARSRAEAIVAANSDI